MLLHSGLLWAVFGNPSGRSGSPGGPPGASWGALWGSLCLLGCMVKPTREVGEPGPFRLLPAAGFEAFWALGGFLWTPPVVSRVAAAPRFLSEKMDEPARLSHRPLVWLRGSYFAALRALLFVSESLVCARQSLLCMQHVIFACFLTWRKVPMC